MGLAGEGLAAIRAVFLAHWNRGVAAMTFVHRVRATGFVCWRAIDNERLALATGNRETVRQTKGVRGTIKAKGDEGIKRVFHWIKRQAPCPPGKTPRTRRTRDERTQGELVFSLHVSLT